MIKEGALITKIVKPYNNVDTNKKINISRIQQEFKRFLIYNNVALTK
jgi:hypothetical protein